MRVLASLLLAALALGSSTVVTPQNIFASEQYWPYHVALTQAVKKISPGTLGVLVRLESAEVARIDFGRDGLLEVPVGSTDLVDRANRIRLGQLTKNSPNFVLAIGPRLVDSGSAVMHTFDYGTTGAKSAFLAVFADLGDEGFAALAQALAPLAERPRLLTILFPQGEHADTEVHAKLRALSWPVPFVFSYLTEPYTRSLMPEQLRPPAVQLQTPEGRVLFQSRWTKDTMAELSGAIDASLGQTRALVTDPAR